MIPFLFLSAILHIAHESSSKIQQALCPVYNCSLLRPSWSYLPRHNEGQSSAAANLKRKTWLGRKFTFGASLCLAKVVCWYLVPNSVVEIHGFSDVSIDAYGGCIYIVYMSQSQEELIFSALNLVLPHWRPSRFPNWNYTLQYYWLN